jgi:hypothetical protein
MEQPGTYDRIWEHQGGRCPICGRIGRYAKKKFLEHPPAWDILGPPPEMKEES